MVNNYIIHCMITYISYNIIIYDIYYTLCNNYYMHAHVHVAILTHITLLV